MFKNKKKKKTIKSNYGGSESIKHNASIVLSLEKDKPPKTIYTYHIPEEKNKYPVYDIPPDGKSKWMGGAFTLCFVYSKNNGNFVIRGYHSEVINFLENNFTHYFCYISMWCNGQSRGHWKFWKDKKVSIFEPSPRSKYMKSYKYTVVKYDNNDPFRRIKELEFKRMPHRWIPEFDKL